MESAERRAIRRPMSPKQAAACCQPVDGLLDTELFKALGDPTRAALLACLVKCGRGCTVSEVAECCSVDLSVVSRHLAILHRAKILDAARQGRTVTYIVRYEHVSQCLRALADSIEECRPGEAGTSCGPGCC